MIVYLHHRPSGAPDPALAPYYGQVASYHRSIPAVQIRHVYVNETTSAPDVIAAVVAASPAPNSIWELMMNCHGSPGRLHMGTGITVSQAAAFAGLRSRMTPATSSGSGSVQLPSLITVGCCYAAAGQQVAGSRQGCVVEASAATNGLTLMMLIAQHSGALVIGALDEQVTWELNGPVLTVQPDGNYSVRQGREVPWIRPGMSRADLTCH